MSTSPRSCLLNLICSEGGLGVIGGLGYTPKILRQQVRNPNHTRFFLNNPSSQIQAIKAGLVDKSLPFGVDLLIPQVGGSARKTNVSERSS